MLFSIYCLDHPDGYARRIENYDAHLAYLSQTPVKIVLSGPLLNDSGDLRIGSLLIVNAESLKHALEFSDMDPFRLNDVWATVRINGFQIAFDRRQDLKSI